jgi:hypothetical protein
MPGGHVVARDGRRNTRRLQGRSAWRYGAERPCVSGQGECRAGLAPLRRDRGHVHRGPGHRGGVRAAQDRCPRARRAGREVQPAHRHRIRHGGPAVRIGGQLGVHMPLSAFTDKAAPPPDDELRATLGAAFPLWESARQRLAALCDRYDEAWGFTSASTGWGLRAKQDGRIIVYLTPRTGEFLASFALGDRALRAARASELPPSVLAPSSTTPGATPKGRPSGSPSRRRSTSMPCCGWPPRSSRPRRDASGGGPPPGGALRRDLRPWPRAVPGRSMAPGGGIDVDQRNRRT